MKTEVIINIDYKVMHENSDGKFKFLGYSTSREYAFKIIRNFLNRNNYKYKHFICNEYEDGHEQVDIGLDNEFFHIYKIVERIAKPIPTDMTDIENTKEQY